MKLDPKTIGKISAAGLAMIAGFEGIRYVAYPDVVNVPTICVGHTYKVKIGDKADYKQCMMWLQEDTEEAGDAVRQCTTVPITQGQYDALVSFAFNVGGTAYCRSTLLKKLEAGDCRGAADEFLRWNKAGGKVYPGLVSRRNAEREMFLKGCNE
jgi:lysozyme